MHVVMALVGRHTHAHINTNTMQFLVKRIVHAVHCVAGDGGRAAKTGN